MAVAPERDKARDRLEVVTDALQRGALAEVRSLLEGLHPAETAHLLESLPTDEREVVWELVAQRHEGDVLMHLREDVRAGLIKEMDTEELVAATGRLDTDDLADLLYELPDSAVHEVLRSMDVQNRQRLEAVLSYPEDTAGGLMNVDTITVRADVTLDVVLRYLRLRGQIPEMTDSLIVVNRDDRYLGVLTLTDLLTKSPSLTVAEVMLKDVEAIPAALPAAEVAQLFERRDLISGPVVNEAGRLMGRITIDDVVDVIREEAEHSLLGMAGLGEQADMFAPVLVSARYRALWLGINLMTAFVASWVIGRFESTIEKVVALAVLMPIVASMGGIAGSQTLTLVIRGVALRQIETSNARRLLTKELAVGLLNGVLWATVVALIAILWFKDLAIGAIIAAAIIINLFAAALAGVTIPLMMRRFGADPALGGGVILTTVTDVVGFLAFLGLATMFLM
jgi:magnesium transporter